MSWVTPKTNWAVTDGVFNTDLNRMEGNLLDMVTFQTSGGTSTAITLTGTPLIDGFMKSFYASLSNARVATKVNGINLYRANTTSTPLIVAGRSYDIMYNLANNCYYIVR